LLMYLDPGDVRDLIVAIAGRWPRAEIMFDVIPTWFSKKTLKGYRLTPQYSAPPMPWALNRSAIESTLKEWLPGHVVVGCTPLGPFRGLRGRILPLCARMPGLRDLLPTVVHVKT